MLALVVLGIGILNMLFVNVLARYTYLIFIVFSSLIQIYIVNYFDLNNFTSIIEAGILTIYLYPNVIGMYFVKLICMMYIPITLYIFYYTKYRNIQITYIYGSLTTAILAGFANNLTTTFIAYELLTLTTIPLIYKDHSPQSIYYLKLYIKQLITTALFLFLPAILYLNNIIPNIDYTNTYYLHEQLPAYQSYLLLALLILGVVKAAILPLKWLIYASRSEYPVSAVLHSVSVVKAGLISLMKIISSLYGMEFIMQLEFLKYIIQISIVYSSIRAFLTLHSKRILIYSTMSQLSIIFLIFISSKDISVSLQYITHHSYTKLALFIILSKLYLTYQNEKITEPNPAINYIDIILLIAGFIKLSGVIGVASSYKNNLGMFKYTSTFLSVLYPCRLFYYYFQQNEIKIYSSLHLSLYPIIIYCLF